MWGRGRCQGVGQKYLGQASVKKSIDLFYRLIAPIVLYGCEIWSIFSQHQINTMSTNPHTFGHYSLNMNS